MKNIIVLIYPILLLIFILYVNPIKILFSTSIWKTQTIIYQNKLNENYKVEFQMQDVGALGYNKRKVEVYYLTKYFMITKEIDSNIIKDLNWEKVNIHVNEHNLKGG